MNIIKQGDVEPVEVKADKQGNAAEGTSIQVLVDHGPNFVLRVFTVKPGGHTPLHAHPWEHEVYVLSGSARTVGAVEAEISAGDAVYIPPGEEHSFVNTGDREVKFICVVPKDAG